MTPPPRVIELDKVKEILESKEVHDAELLAIGEFERKTRAAERAALVNYLRPRIQAIAGDGSELRELMELLDCAAAGAHLFTGERP